LQIIRLRNMELFRSLERQVNARASEPANPAEGSDSMTPTMRRVFSRGTIEMPPGLPEPIMLSRKASSSSAAWKGLRALHIAESILSD